MPPNEKISDLGAASPLVLSDHVLVARGSAPPNLKATIQAVLALGGGVGGGGTINKIPIWVSPGVLGDSTLTQSGGTIISNGQFSVQKTQVGSGVVLSVINLDNTDGASSAVLRAAVGGISGGDAYLSLAVAGGQSYVLGIDNSDGDKFVGSVGAALGTGNWLEVTTARGITLDAASGQTVALAVNSVEELQVSGTAVTIATNDLVVTVGGLTIAGNSNLIGNTRIGLAGVATQLLQVITAGSGSARMRIENSESHVDYGTDDGEAQIWVDGTLEMRMDNTVLTLPSNDLTLGTGDLVVTGGNAQFGGDLFWTGDGSGLPFAHIYVDGTQVIAVALTVNTPAEVLDDGTTSAGDGWLAGEMNRAIMAITDKHHFIVQLAGRWKIVWEMSFSMVAPGANVEVHGGIAINGIPVRDVGEAHRTIANNADTGNMGGTAILDLASNDQVSLWLENTTNSADVVVVHGNITATMVGGT